LHIVTTGLRLLAILVAVIATSDRAVSQLPDSGTAISNVGVMRAAGKVDAVYSERLIPADTVAIGDFTSYLLARLGVPPFPDSMGFRVRSDTAGAEIRGKLADFPEEALAELGPLFSFIDPNASFVARVRLVQAQYGIMRFRLQGVSVGGVPVPDLLLIPALREYSRRYPVLAANGWELMIAIPDDGRARLMTDGIELRTENR
jgi:hypothetical protein